MGVGALFAVALAGNELCEAGGGKFKLTIGKDEVD